MHLAGFEPGRQWRLIAGVASLAAAGVHLGAAGMHLEEWRAAGVFMLVAGVAQLVWAWWIVAGAPRLVVEAGIAGNAAVISLWVASRTAGLPFGPEAGSPEHVHGPDLLATLLEVVVVAASIALASGARARPPALLVRAVAMCVVAVVFVGGDDPAREQLVATATLALAFSARAFVAFAPRPLVIRPDWRSHGQASLVRRARGDIGAIARAGIGAR